MPKAILYLHSLYPLYFHFSLICVELVLRKLYSKSEQAWIPVQIIGAMTNHPPKPSYISMFILEVDHFILTPLSTATVDAEDEETSKELLVFNITTPPAEGFITHLSDHTRPVSSFTWLDLNDMLIGYQPSNISHSQRRDYEVTYPLLLYFFFTLFKAICLVTGVCLTFSNYRCSLKFMIFILRRAQQSLFTCL